MIGLAILLAATGSDVGISFATLVTVLVVLGILCLGAWLIFYVLGHAHRP
jgi:hypothetical protein